MAGLSANAKAFATRHFMRADVSLSQVQTVANCRMILVLSHRFG